VCVGVFDGSAVGTGEGICVGVFDGSAVGTAVAVSVAVDVRAGSETGSSVG
jgi:hypothetical protein